MQSYSNISVKLHNNNFVRQNIDYGDGFDGLQYVAGNKIFSLEASHHTDYADLYLLNSVLLLWSLMMMVMVVVMIVMVMMMELMLMVMVVMMMMLLMMMVMVFQIGAGLYTVGRPIQKSNITQQKRTAKSASITPCLSREGPYSTVFSVSRPMDPLMWLAGLLALSGDVETNPGPSTQTWTCDMCSTEITRRQTSYRCNSSPSHWVHEHCTTLRRNTVYTPTWKFNIHNQQNNTITDQHLQLTNNNNNMQQNLNINQPHSINNNKTQLQINSKKTITIIQININGLTTKVHELKNLTDNTKIDIITIQETKLKPTHRTPYLKDYTAIRTDRTYKNGGGLMTYIKNDIIFTELKTPHTTNHKLTELQHIKIHLANHKHLNIFNIYIPPRDTTNPDHSNSQEDITNCMTHILNTNNTILTGDLNAHHTLWHSPTTDNRGTLIADLINSSNQIVLNTNTLTRIPTKRNQQATSPDISTASNTIYNNITWSTLNALNSDHNPIKISDNTKTKFRLIQHRRSYTNYRKADWQGFTNSIENALTDTTDVTDVHKSNKILTLLLLDADKHYIPRGKINLTTPYFLKTSEHK